MTDTRLDGELIALLKQNARLPTAELARRLGVARSTIQARLERLEQTGAILGYTIRPGKSEEDKHLVRAHVAIRVSPPTSALGRTASRETSGSSDAPCG